MSDETPDQVTLADLLPVDFVPENDDVPLMTCTRCGGVVRGDGAGESRETHERWHAAIENLSITGVYELPGPLGGALHFGPIEAHSAGVSARTEQPADEPTLRAQLIDKIKEIDGGLWLEDTSHHSSITSPVHWADQLLPVVEAWAEEYVQKYADRARDAEAELLRVRGEPPFGLRKALLDALQVQETGQDIVALVRELRAEYGKLELAAEQPPGTASCLQHREFIGRVWQIALEAGHVSGSSVTDWLQAELADLNAVRHNLRIGRDDQAAPHEWTSQHMANVLTQQGAALERLRDVVREAGCPVDSNVIYWIEQQLTELAKHRFKLNDALGIVGAEEDTDPYEAVAALHTEVDRLRAELAGDVNARMNEQRAAFIGLLQLAGRGRAAYAENLGEGFGGYETLMTQASNFYAAARLIADPTRICLQIPTSMLPEAGNLTDNEPADDLSDEVLSDLLLLVGVTPSAAQLSSWTPEQREQAACWAAAVHADASDNDVDVPERPAFLDEPAKAEPCPSLWLDREAAQLYACEASPAVHDNEGNHYATLPSGKQIYWDNSDAGTVLAPWPLDQEPPAGIDALREVDIPHDALVFTLRRYHGGWIWQEGVEPIQALHGHTWAETTRSCRELHVVRP